MLSIIHISFTHSTFLSLSLSLIHTPSLPHTYSLSPPRPPYMYMHVLHALCRSYSVHDIVHLSLFSHSICLQRYIYQPPKALDIDTTVSLRTTYCYGACVFNVHTLLTLDRLSIAVDAVLSSIEPRRDRYAIAKASSLHCFDNVTRGQTSRENELIDL